MLRRQAVSRGCADLSFVLKYATFLLPRRHLSILLKNSLAFSGSVEVVEVVARDWAEARSGEET